MSTLDLRKFVAPEFVFGAGARLLAGRYARNWALKRVLLVTDPGVEKAGWARQTAEGLETEGLECRRFSGVSPNPRDHEVMAGADLFRSLGCDGLLAVGGGSVMDCAKGIGIVVANGENVLDFEGVDRVRAPMPPLICVPTTAGTSADVSQFAIINNTRERVKIAIISKAVVPDVALIDPETLSTLDPFLTACTGMDALVHAVEAFVSNASSAVTDLHALEAVRLIREHLEASVAEPQNQERRNGMMLASLEAGLAFSNASLGCVHAVAHSLGGYLDLPHGECNASLLPHVVDFNFDAAPERYRKLGEALGQDFRGLTAGQAKKRLVESLMELRRQVGIDGLLGQRGLTSGDIPVLAGKAMRDPCNATNPRTPTQRDLEVILEESR
jgi:alcohol dehydrogenase class IV